MLEPKHTQFLLPPGADLGEGISWSPSGDYIAAILSNQHIAIWNCETQKAVVSEMHGGNILGLCWGPGVSQTLIATAAEDGRVRLVDATTGKILSVDRTHKAAVECVAWSSDGRFLASGSRDCTVIMRDPDESDRSKDMILVPGRAWIRAIAFHPSRMLLAAAQDAVHICNMSERTVDTSYSDHDGMVRSIAWSPDGKLIATAGADGYVALWDVERQRSIWRLEGHTNEVTAVEFSPDSKYLASASVDGIANVWDCSNLEIVSVLDITDPLTAVPTAIAWHPSGHRFAVAAYGAKSFKTVDFFPNPQPAAQMETYVNAKIVLVGDSGVGKSGLGYRIAEGEFVLTESTHGAQYWQLPVPIIPDITQDHHIHTQMTIWDLAGQPEYRLTHQLFLDDTDVAILLFDGSDAVDTFKGVRYWAKALERHLSESAIKLLVSSRVDVCTVTAVDEDIDALREELSLDQYFTTSAKTGKGVDLLFNYIKDNIPWSQLPRIRTPILFRAIREQLLKYQGDGVAAIDFNQLLEDVESDVDEMIWTPLEVENVIDLFHTRGLIQRVRPSEDIDLVLLQPELLNKFAASIIQAARLHPKGLGAVSESEVLRGGIEFQDSPSLKPREQKSLLEATVEAMISHGLCFREMGMLIFPNQQSKRRSESECKELRFEVSLSFAGSIEILYSSLVVRLGYTDYFQLERQWRNMAEFSRGDGRLGFALDSLEDASAELRIYFDESIRPFDRVTFVRFVLEHLRYKGVELEERYKLTCPGCKREIIDGDAIEARRLAEELTIPCQYCETPVLIPESVEDAYSAQAPHEQRLAQLELHATTRTHEEVQQFRATSAKHGQSRSGPVSVLHLSDLHFRPESKPAVLRFQLQTDLEKELKVDRLDYIVITGDIASTALASEYANAFSFVNDITKRFGLDSSKVLIVPGNHDVDWRSTKAAYDLVYKDDVPEPRRQKGEYVPVGEVGFLVRNDTHYPRRFSPFNNQFYSKVFRGSDYPIDECKQYSVLVDEKRGICMLGLNSSAVADHLFPQRFSVNLEALAAALDELEDCISSAEVRIAAVHHPPSFYPETAFLDLLRVHRFSTLLTGHVHKAETGLYQYDAERKIHIVGAGTFGALSEERPTHIPLQYNLLQIDLEDGSITVNTRRREEDRGAWCADARWGDRNKPEPSYKLPLS